jgi:hypothetical protein
MSTGRALALAAALSVLLFAAGTGVLAAADVLLPAHGPASNQPGNGSPTAEPSTVTVPLPPPANRPTSRPANPAPATGTNATAARPAAPPQPGPGVLTAFGARTRDWDAGHRRDPAVSTAYDPDPALGGDGRLADRYVRVLPVNERVVQYSIQLPRQTSLTAASARALAELPPDARLVWQQQRRACAQAAYLSATLATALTDLGDPRGAVLIEYRSGVVAGGAYEAGDVTTATLSALDAPTAADGPLC